MKEFSELLREAAADIWDDQHQHPFVQGIGDGSLDLERFKHWIRQDYLYLIDYSPVMALAAARSPRPDHDDSLCLVVERNVAYRDVTPPAVRRQLRNLDRRAGARTAGAYDPALYRFSPANRHHRRFQRACRRPASLHVGYSEIGRQLATKPRPADARYAEWIDSYASDEFVTLVEWCRDLIEPTSGRRRTAERERMRDAFVTSSRWELAFWEMAWQLER